MVEVDDDDALYTNDTTVFHNEILELIDNHWRLHINTINYLNNSNSEGHE